MDNLRFFRRPLPGRAETASPTKNWISQVNRSCNFYNDANILHNLKVTQEFELVQFDLPAEHSTRKKDT